MKKKSSSILGIFVFALIVTVIVLTVLLISGSTNKVVKLKDGKEVIVKFGNGEKMTADDIWTKFKESYILSVLLNEVDEKILNEEYKKDEKEIQSYLDQSLTQLKANYTDENGNYDEDSLMSALTNAGYSTIDDYLDSVRLSHLKSKATTDYAKTQLSDKEIKDYYNKNIYGKMSATHILVKPASSSSTDTDAAKAKASEIIKAIQKDVKSGTKVADAFAKYKDDSSVTYEVLTDFEYEDMVAEFSKATYDLKVNKYTTSPVKTSYGYHVILKTKQSDKPSLEDSKTKISEKIAEDKVKEDSTMSVVALDKLREKYGVKFEDAKLATDYDRYINYQVNSAKNN